MSTDSNNKTAKPTTPAPSIPGPAADSHPPPDSHPSPPPQQQQQEQPQQQQRPPPSPSMGYAQPLSLYTQTPFPGYPPQQAPPSPGLPPQQAPPSPSFPPQQAPPSPSFPPQHAFPPPGFPQFQTLPPHGFPQQAPQQQPFGAPQYAYSPVAPPQGYYPPSQPPYGQPPYQQLPYAPQYGYPSPQPGYYPPQPGYPPQPYPPFPPCAQAPNSQMDLQRGQYLPPPAKPRQYSPGYAPGEALVGYDATMDAAIITKALGKSSHLDIGALIKILPMRTPLQIESLKQHMASPPHDLVKNTVFTDEAVKLGVHGLLMGPRDCDAFLLHHVLTASSSSSRKFGTGTFKAIWALSLVLLGRKDGDIDAIKASFCHHYGDTLLHLLKEAFRKDLLLGNLYMNALENISNPGVSEVPESAREQVQAAIDREADELFTATVGNIEGNRFAWIFTTSSSERLKDIAAAYQKKQGVSLAATVEKKLKKTEIFRNELLYILRGLEDMPKRDAELLEDTMKGFGTRDTQLVFRLLTVAWDKDHLSRVKEAYKRTFPSRGNLVTRIEGDTSGDQQKLLRAIAMSDGKR